MSIEIIKKAYAITAHIEEEYFYDMPYIGYGTPGKAKISNLLEFDCAKLCGISKHYGNPKYPNHDIDEVGFMDLSCKRAKEYDIVLFNGEKLKRYQVNDILAKQEREKYYDKILEYNKGKLAYIWKGIRGGYYGPNYCGYYTDKLGAGIYSVEDAIKECRNMSLSDGFDVVVIDIEARNNDIDERISSLKKQIDILESKKIK